MARPMILAVEDDLERLRLVRRELVKRYSADYRVVCVSTASEGLRILDEAVVTGREVALVLGNLWLPCEAGPTLFAQARARHPGVRCVALINWGPPNPTVLKAAGAGVIDDWIAAPRLPRDEHFHQGISAILYTWWRRHTASFTAVRIIDEATSARSHEIREWLSRNTLRFKSLDVASEEARQLLTQYDLNGSRLPVVITAIWPRSREPFNPRDR